MSWYFRVLGSSLILLAAIMLGRGYSSYAERAIDEYDGFISLFLHMKGRISCFLLPPSEIFRDFECDALERCGLLPKLRYGIAFSEALSESLPKLAISKETKRVILGFSDSFGSEYRDGEIAKIEQAIAEIKTHRDKAAELLSSKIKLAGTLLAAAALGIVIFLL